MEARTQQSVLAFHTGIHLCPELEALAKICYICDFGVATKFLVKIIVNSNYIIIQKIFANTFNNSRHISWY